MRQIGKAREPSSLTKHRATPHACYDNIPVPTKDELRDALVREQRGLCCYCMSRIRAVRGSMKIEHWHCQIHHRAQQLVYGNLLGGCMGGENQPAHLQCCDTRKGDQSLRWNPADPSHLIESRIRYALDGTIKSDDPQFDWQLNEVLNLNLPALKASRRAAFDLARDWWKFEQKRLRGPIPREVVVRRIDQWLGGAGNLEPFRPVTVWVIRKKLESLP